VRTDVHHDADAAAGVAARWDALACAAGRPLASPHWLLAWWRHMAPPGALLRVIEARRGDATVGMLPLYAVRRGGLWHYATLGTPGMSLRGAGVIDPSAPRAAAALAGALSALSPAPASVRLGQVDPADPVAAAVAAMPGWSTRRVGRTGAPVLDLDPDGHDAWLAGKSGNFRQDLRRKRRRLERDGGALSRVDDAEGLLGILPAFDAMHEARWGARSPLVAAPARAMVREAGTALAARGRLTAECVRHGDELVAVQFFLHAGATTLFWNGAWDERWAQASPGMLAVVEGIAGAHARGAALVDLGDGDQGYKSRLAGRESPVSDLRAHPRNARGAAALALRAARAAARRLLRRR